MIIYNITLKVNLHIHTDWLYWQQQEHIPEILNTGCFINANILRLLEIDDQEGPTYAIQFHAESKALYNRYIEAFAGIMRQKSFDKWGDQVIAFRTVMQVVN